MSRSVEITEEAYADIAESWTWYEGQQAGLGDAFLLACRETLERMRRQPEIFAMVDAKLRRAMMRRFPFGVYFVVESQRVVVVAVLHSSRDPQEWRRRIQDHDS